MTWSDGADDREESIRRLLEAISQAKYDISRSWKIFSRSFLAMLGLVLVILVSTISFLADDIAVEHPYRNLQDTEDLWWIDYEPSRQAPFSEECDWHEQKIDMFDMRRDNNNRTRAWSDEVWSAERGKIIRNPLHVTEILMVENTLGYPLNFSWVSVDPTNDTWLIVSQEALDDDELEGSMWVTFVFNNEDMHHSWMPDGYDVCILGTNNEGQDMFSKILYGSRISLKIGITVAFCTVTLGTIIGCISGYFGGRTDEVIMRICDVFFAIPGLILAMAFVAAMEATVRLSMPMQYAALVPLALIAIFIRSAILSKLAGEERESAGTSITRFSMLGISILVVLLSLEMWSRWWPEPSAETLSNTAQATRLGLILLFLALVSAMTFADRRLTHHIPVSTIIERIGVDYTNPYRYVTIRTALIFASVFLLYSAAGSSESEFILIKDFDRLWKIQVALIFTGWPGYARLIRGQVLYVKEMSFVEAAKSVGAPSGRIMFRHILPNAWAPLLVAFTLDIGGTILSASGLSFIGLGAEPGTAEWGILVAEGRRWFPDDWWLITFPGLAIGVTTLGFNLLGDGLRDVVDPKNRR